MPNSSLPEASESISSDPSGASCVTSSRLLLPWLQGCVSRTRSFCLRILLPRKWIPFSLPQSPGCFAENRERESPVPDHFVEVRQPASGLLKIAGQRSIVARLRYICTELFVEIRDAKVCINNGGPVACFLHCFLDLVILVMNLANDLLQDILHRDNPLCSAEFVNHDRQVNLFLLKFPQKLTYLLGFVDKIGLTDDVLKDNEVAVLKQAQEVLAVNDPDNVVHAPVINGQPGIPLLDNLPHKEIPGAIDIESHDIRPGDHYLLGRRIRKLEDACYQLMLGLIQGTAQSACLEHLPQVFFR